MQRDPSKIRLGADGTWPLRFDTLVQPVLDKHCVSCHDPAAPGNPVTAKFDLSASKAWQSLIR